MQRVRRSRRGLAEIVGTLMLVLIVVSAVTVFAAFVASEEQQRLAQDGYNDAKALESLRIVSVVPFGLLNNSSDYRSMNVTVGSSDPNPMTVNGIAFDGDVVTNVTTSTPGQSAAVWGDPFGAVFPGDGVVTFGITFTPYVSATLGSVPNSFGISTLLLPANSPLTLDFYTTYANEFGFALLPPVAEIAINTIPLGSSYTNVLDGLASFVPLDANASVDSWQWNGTETITNCSSGCTNTTETLVQAKILPSDPTYGAEVETLIPLLPSSTTGVFQNYTLTLTVTATDGLEGTTTVSYEPAG
jgi:flagellin-like protein